mgnify:CR=1 FL=1
MTAIRKYREEQPTDAKVVREVAKVMLQPTAEVIGVAISGQRMLLLKRLDSIVQIVSCVTLDAGNLYHNLLNLVPPPLTRSIQREFSCVEHINKTS